MTEYPLTAALIFFPLATGAISLANLLSLVPMRIVTLMSLVMTFLGIGTLIFFPSQKEPPGLHLLTWLRPTP